MKKNGILAISLVAVFAVSNAYADIASTTYVQKAASVSNGDGIISTISVADDGTPTVTRRQLANTDIADRGIDAGKVATTKAGTEYDNMGEEAKETAIPTVTLVENIADTAAGTAVSSAIKNYATKSALDAEIAARTSADEALGDRIDAEATARQTADNNITAKFGDLGTKTVAQAIADAKTSATYDDTALKGRVSANETAISNIQSSAAMTSGVTKAIVDSVTNATTGLAATRTLAQQGVVDAAAAQEAADDAAAAAATALPSAVAAADGKAVAAQNTANTAKTTAEAALPKASANVAADGTYIKAGTDVKANLGLLDTATKAAKDQADKGVADAAAASSAASAAQSTANTANSTANANKAAIENATTGLAATKKIADAALPTATYNADTTVTDGNYVKAANKVNANLKALDTAVKAAADAATSSSNTALDSAKAYTDTKVNALDLATQTGNGVIKTVTQTDGKVTVTRGTVATAEITDGAVTNEKITSVASSKVTGLTELATLAMPAACATNECALVYDKTTKAPKWEVVR